MRLSRSTSWMMWSEALSGVCRPSRSPIASSLMTLSGVFSSWETSFISRRRSSRCISRVEVIRLKAALIRPQLVRGRDRQPGRVPLGNCLGCFRQGRHWRRDPLGKPGGQQDGDASRQQSADHGDVQESVEEPMRLGRQELLIHVHVDVAHGPVSSQVEHRLAMSAQIGHGGPRRQIGQVVLHHPAVYAGDDDSDLVVAK